MNTVAMVVGYLVIAAAILNFVVGGIISLLLM
jgi:hypothetical protein